MDQGIICCLKVHYQRPLDTITMIMLLGIVSKKTIKKTICPLAECLKLQTSADDNVDEDNLTLSKWVTINKINHWEALT